MINSNINEITVWLDSLEDSNIDVSSLRFLCIYNYMSIIFGAELLNSNGYEIYGDGINFDGSGTGVDYELYNGFTAIGNSWHKGEYGDGGTGISSSYDFFGEGLNIFYPF